MALTLEQLVVELAAEAGNYAKQLDQVNNQTQSWASGLASSASALLGGVVVGATSAVVGGMVAIGGAAFDVSRETEIAAANMAASLGIPLEEAEKLAQIAKDVYGNNFADSVIDAGGVVAEAYQRMGDVSEEEMQRSVQYAVALRDSFGIDTAESLNTVNTLMENLGLTSDEAFDFIAKGAQKGLNVQGDMLDSLGEYTNLMGDLGFTAPQVFSLMETGMEGGVLGTDKIMDALKEMGIILNEGGDDARVALAGMGMDYDEMARTVASGEATWADYFDSIVGGLNAIEDPIARSQAQVAIFGTKGEDLGVSFTEGLTTASTSMADMEGAADQLNAKYNTFGDMFAGIWRKAVVSVSPATDKLLELANDAMPYVGAAFDKLAEWIPPAIDFAVDAVDKGVDFISGLFEGPLGDGIDEGIGAFETVQDWIDTNMPLIQQTVATVLGAITGFWDSNGDRIMSIVDGFLFIVQTLFDTYLNNALDIVTAVMQLINGDVEGAGETLKGIAERTMSAFLSIVSTYIGMVQNAFGDIDWGEIGRSIIDGVAAGLSGAGHLLVSAAQGAASGAMQGVKDLLGIRSPSRVMAEEVGLPMVEGIALGFAKSLPMLENLSLDMGGVASTGAAAVPVLPPINIYITSSDPTTSGDSVVQSLRAYGLAA